MAREEDLRMNDSILLYIYILFVEDLWSGGGNSVSSVGVYYFTNM